MALPTSDSNPEPAPFRSSEEPKTRHFDDRETFIRQAFAQNPRVGYELLFRRYYQPLYSHATRLVYSPDVADDIVSEVFLNFWQKESYTNVTTSYRLYLFMSVRYAAFAHLRREFKHESLDILEAQQAALDTPSAEKIILYDELYLSIDQAIKSLPPQNQRVFMLSRFDGKSHAEIARLLSISPKTVEVHIHKALRLLRTIIAEL
ncbi:MULTISPECIES: RNA polymerase sigma-70 factor [Spirosoma]|jgi:RNA polymerase sigma-70 factor (family 1)|uniref:RNA polymerase sigma-70 factor n=1 Tax=Spirosoma sordidisoli TaxID=2502893 RepID=A0A4Q2UT31_9BACT|nr:MULTISPECIES: RNA polymerase sigma-70 factor [Spirosoma]RYC70955.1 RNA polymerase sigma-70 factor [Spirosoma sordidisoli]